jgi:hypothetical protein
VRGLPGEPVLSTFTSAPCACFLRTAAAGREKGGGWQSGGPPTFSLACAGAHAGRRLRAPFHTAPFQPQQNTKPCPHAPPWAANHWRAVSRLVLGTVHSPPLSAQGSGRLHVFRCGTGAAGREGPSVVSPGHLLCIRQCPAGCVCTAGSACSTCVPLFGPAALQMTAEQARVNILLPKRTGHGKQDERACSRSTWTVCNVLPNFDLRQWVCGSMFKLTSRVLFTSGMCAGSVNSPVSPSSGQCTHTE